MGLYDEEVRREVAKAKADGFAGESLTIRVAKRFDVDALTPAQVGLLSDAFRRIVHPAAKPPKDESKQTKLFM